MSMVGRCYRWDGRVWRVIARWGVPAPDRTFVCADGRIIVSRGRQVFDDYPGRARALGHGAGPRNVLIEDVQTGQRVCLPFRGLRRIQPEEGTTA